MRPQYPCTVLLLLGLFAAAVYTQQGESAAAQPEANQPAQRPAGAADLEPDRSEWSIQSARTHEIQHLTETDPDDVWLTIKMRNDSGRTLYVPGVGWGNPWYMIETYVQDADKNVWHHQNIGVDRDLEMLPVKADEVIELLHRIPRAHIGRSMVLTFSMSYSDKSKRGHIPLLVGDIEIPAIKAQ